MTRAIPLLLAFLSVSWLGDQVAYGQLFGNRNLGQPLARRPSVSRSASSRTPSSGGSRGAASPASRLFDENTFENVGALDENARYLRGNRDITDFVGAATGDEQRFVGAQTAGAAIEEIRSAVDDLEIETGTDVNATVESAVPPGSQLNPPRLQLGFSPATRLHAQMADKLTERLRKSLKLGEESSIKISVEGDKVVLEGQVPSARQCRLAELLVRFEPGVYNLDNRLQVAPAGDEPPPLPHAIR